MEILKHTPTVSVIIPAYNAEDYLAEAINSVIEQTVKDIEIVIVDDGSTDKTRDIALSFGHKINYYHIPNSGPAVARNLGIKMSSGRYIAFLDADDWWFPRKLETQLNILHKNPEAVFICSDWFNGATGEEPRNSGLAGYEVLRKAADFDLMLRENFVNTSTVVIDRQKLLKTGLFMESLRGAEDRHLWLRLLLTGNAILCKEILAFRRFHSANTTATISFIESQIKMMDDVITWPSVRSNSERLSLALKRRRNLLINLAHKLSTMRKYKESASVYKKLYKESPLDFGAGVRWVLFRLLGGAAGGRRCV